jgi:hypothetical protein
VAACQEKVDAAGGGGHIAERRSGTAMRKTLCGSRDRGSTIEEDDGTNFQHTGVRPFSMLGFDLTLSKSATSALKFSFVE